MTVRSASIFALLLASLAATSGRASLPSCRANLLRDREAAYLYAETSATRAKAKDAFFEELSRLESAPDAAIPAASLRDAWVRVALAKASTPRLYSSLDDSEVASLVGDPNALRWMRLAYAVRDARLRAGELFRRVAGRLLPEGSRRAKSVGQIAKIHDFLVTSPKVSNAARTRTILGHAGAKARDYLLGLLDFLSPLPIPERWVRRTAPVFEKLERNPDVVLEADEARLLEEHGATEAFERRRVLLKNHPKYFRALRISKKAARVARFSFVAGSVALVVYELSEEDGTVGVDRFLSDPKLKLRDDQVQLLNETYPFPHIALRIGDEVFSYGQTHLSVSPIDRYLAAESDLRSVQAVTLDLSKDEVFRLRRYLRLQEWKTYKNITFVNDCSTMAIRALERETSFRVPRVVDPSPSATLMYLAAERVLPKSAVSSIRLVLLSPKQDPTAHVLRAAYVNAKEAQIYGAFLLPYQGMRLGLEARFGTRGLQEHEPGVKASLARSRDAVASEIAADPMLSLYRTNVEKLRASEKQRKIASEYFASIYSNGLKKLDSNEAEILDLLGEFYRLQSYAAEEKRLLGESNFDFGEAIRDPGFVEEVSRLLDSLEPDSSDE